MPPLPSSSRNSRCGNWALSTSMVGGVKPLAGAAVLAGGCEAGAMPTSRRHLGHRPWGASADSSAPHRGQRFASSLAAFPGFPPPSPPGGGAGGAFSPPPRFGGEGPGVRGQAPVKESPSLPPLSPEAGERGERHLTGIYSKGRQ